MTEFATSEFNTDILHDACVYYIRFLKSVLATQCVRDIL